MTVLQEIEALSEVLSSSQVYRVESWYQEIDTIVQLQKSSIAAKLGRNVLRSFGHLFGTGQKI
jgi:hypothetical protein